MHPSQLDFNRNRLILHISFFGFQYWSDFTKFWFTPGLVKEQKMATIFPHHFILEKLDYVSVSGDFPGQFVVLKNRTGETVEGEFVYTDPKEFFSEITPR
jgi:hypothetical protein